MTTPIVSVSAGTAVSAQKPDATASRRVWLVLGALTLIGFALRIYRLNHSSLWMDETLTIARADPALSWREFFLFPETAPHPVWHHGMLKLWLTVFGYGEFQARLLSAIIGALGIPATYLLARTCAGVPGSLIAALVAAVSYYLIFYAQELTPYTHWYAAACLSYFFFLALCRTGTVWSSVGYTVASLIALHIHFHSAFMIAAQMTAALYFGVLRGGARGVWTMALRFATPGLIIVLSLVPMADQIRSFATKPHFLQAAPPGTFPLQYFYDFFGNSIVYAVLAALPIAMLVFVRLHRWAIGAAPEPAISAGEAQSSISMLLIILVVGLAVPYAVSVGIKPVLFHRYTIYTLPIYLILVAVGFEMIRRQAVRWSLAAALFVASLWVLLVEKAQYSVTVKFDQPREVVRFVATKNAELRIANVRYVSNAPTMVRFYMRASGISAPLLPFVEKEEIAARLVGTAKGEFFWIVVNGWEPNPAMLAFVAARYDKITEARFQRGYAGLYRFR